MNPPLISIITPTLNSAHTIEQSIISVLHQTYGEIEHVFIDGLSEDVTAPVIRTFLSRYHQAVLISEKDNGIYDAMNKGLRVCRGDWIYFLGANDTFHDDHVLTDLYNQGLFDREHIVYGNVVISGDSVWAKNNEVYDGKFDLSKLLRKNICHQGIFYPRSVIEKVGFYSENYPVTADWDYNLRCYSKYQFTYIDRIVAYFQSGGRSAPGDNSKFYNDLPKNVVSYFNLNPNDPALRNEDSPFAPIMKRFDEQQGGSMGVESVLKPKNPTTFKPVSLYPEKISEGISLFTAVKNRCEMLEAALQTWITHDEIDEIIILDWDSDESLKPLVQKYQNGKIMLAVVKDQPKWVLSFAYNLAARLTTRTKILKIDADVKILPGFFESHLLSPGKYFSGNWRIRRDDNEMHLNGVVYLLREDFFRVNGYNEFIKFYGWDDSDLYQRLNEQGLLRNDFNLDTLYHIPHGKRTVFQDRPEYLQKIPDEEWASMATLANRHLGNNYGKWFTDYKMIPFSIEHVSDYLFSCNQIGNDENPVPELILKECETIAIRERLELLGYNFSDALLTQLTRNELIELYNLCFIADGFTVSLRLQEFISKNEH